MSEVTVNATELLGHVVLLATQFPNARYEQPVGGGCQNFSGIVHNCSLGTEGCLIGQGLRRMGHNEGTCRNTESVATLYADGFIISDAANAVNLLQSIQGNQDAGRTWGESLAEAMKYYADPLHW